MKKLLPFCFLLLIGSVSFAQNTFYFNVISPFSVSGSWDNTEFGNVDQLWGWDGTIDSTIGGELVYAESNGEDFRFFCEGNSIDYSGKLVFVDRGDCNFSEKAIFAQEQGALAIIIADPINSTLSDMGAGISGIDVFIPVILLPSGLGDPIRDELLEGTVIFANLSPTSADGSGFLTGNIAMDNNEDCIYQQGENTLGQFKVNIELGGEVKTVYSNNDGSYVVGLPEGDYLVQAQGISSLWEDCPPVSVNVQESQIIEQDLSMNSAIDCPVLTVDISTARLRRCFDNNTYHINYCNEGTMPVDDVFIIVALDDLLLPGSASVPYTITSDNELRFDIGYVELGSCGTILLDVEVLCEDILGQTLCSTAEIFPLRNCGMATAWSGVDVRALGDCDLAEGVNLELKNQGISDMPNSVNYRILADGVIIDNGTYMLMSGESRVFNFPADGRSYRIESDLIEIDDLTNAIPNISVEACSVNGEESSIGFITQFTPPDYGASYDIECTEVIGSYDPNDKAAQIGGYGPKHYIDQNVGLEYKIRFQNTGTDTAFTVIIRDTLSEFLDLSTLRPLASSHPYNFTLTENALAVDFPNILLPDSTVNEPGSNGFITFRIEQLPDVVLESEILNTASIYFDFNDPIITNTVMHTVGKDFIDQVSFTAKVDLDYPIEVFPNPALDHITILGQDQKLLDANFTMYNNLGERVITIPITTLSQNVSLLDLNAGIYFYEISLKDQSVTTGRIVKGER